MAKWHGVKKTVKIFEFDDWTQEKKNCERRVPPTCIRALIKQRAERLDSFIFKFNIASWSLNASIFFRSFSFSLCFSVLIYLHIHNLRKSFLNVLHKSFLSCLFVSPMELSFPFNASPDINTSV